MSVRTAVAAGVALVGLALAVGVAAPDSVRARTPRPGEVEAGAVRTGRTETGHAGSGGVGSGRVGSEHAGWARAGPGRAVGPWHPCSSTVGIEGYSDALDKTTYEGAYVGNLSALARDTDGRIAALSDRSALSTLGAGPRPERVRALADERGAPLDSEALAVDRDGTYLIASETEPSVRRYDHEGRTLERLEVPGELRPAPAGRAVANQTFEGLTLAGGGRTLIAAMEGPLTGDGTDEWGRPLVRMQTWRRATDGPSHLSHPFQPSHPFHLARQYRYPVDRTLGVSEIAALDDGRLLVLERGFTAGVGNTVRLYEADPRRAGGARPLPKKLLADLGDCPSLGASSPQPQANPLLDNIEGMVVAGRASGGRLRVLLVSDDNQSPRQVTRLYALTVRLGR